MRHDDGDIMRSLLVNWKRFDFDPQLLAVLKNTICDGESARRSFTIPAEELDELPEEGSACPLCGKFGRLMKRDEESFVCNNSQDCGVIIELPKDGVVMEKDPLRSYVNKIPCIRCKVRLAHPMVKFCETCVEEIDREKEARRLLIKSVALGETTEFITTDDGEGYCDACGGIDIHADDCEKNIFLGEARAHLKIKPGTAEMLLLKEFPRSVPSRDIHDEIADELAENKTEPGEVEVEDPDDEIEAHDIEIEAKSDLAFELEGFLTKDFEGCPPEALAIYNEDIDGAPIGIAKHPEKGWFVIGTSGQGPYIIWSEKENETDDGE
jgi:hypothetical protein